MFRYKLRTLLIVLALGPPVLGFLVPPLAAWLSKPSPPHIVDQFPSSTLEYHEGPASFLSAR